MLIKQVFYNNFKNRDFFELERGERPWNFFLIISGGEFSFESCGEQFDIGENEIAFFPMNTPFMRKIVRPITFHQFGFICEPSTYSDSLQCGKLDIPSTHVKNIIENIEIINRLSGEKEELYVKTIERIIIENHLYRTKETQSRLTLSDDVDFVIRYMTEHLEEKISVAELADAVHLSNVGLLWKFKRYMHTTPSEFLTRLRMQRAKQLLIESNARINEIAELCGFPNQYYFSNAFKKHYGISPNAYRKQMTT